jgi:hypothetical protein
MNDNFMEIMQIRDKIEQWVVYRDAFLWDDFRTVWHPDGVMKATWTEGPFEQFIKITEEGLKHGLNIMHILGGSAIKVNGDRGQAMTKMIILQRADIDGVLCDVSSYARQYDLWKKHEGKWGLYYRETVADKDRIYPVDNNETVTLDKAILEQCPIEYRHLAYLQTKLGYNVNKDCPRLSGGASLENLYKRGEDWLAGK